MTIPILRSLLLFSVAHLALLPLCQGKETQSESLTIERTKWIVRLSDELPKLDEEDRYHAIALSATALTKVGETERAKQIVEEFLSADRQGEALLFICDVLSQDDQLKAALAVAAEIPAESGAGGTRQRAILLVGIRQAQRGDIEDAIQILGKIEVQDYRDRLVEAIAKAQLKAGDPSAARKTIESIVNEERRRRSDLEHRDFKKVDLQSLDGVHSPMVRAQLQAMFEFSGGDYKADVLRAIAAARKEDRKEMDAQIAEAERKLPLATPLDRATIRALLAIALVEAGDEPAAKAMIEAAQQAGGDEKLGIASLFGDPILVHLLIRLNLKEELQAMLKNQRESDAFGAGITYQASLSVVGGTYAELDRLAEADKLYSQLESSSARVHFANGVLMHLRQPGK